MSLLRPWEHGSRTMTTTYSAAQKSLTACDTGTTAPREKRMSLSAEWTMPWLRRALERQYDLHRYPGVPACRASPQRGHSRPALTADARTRRRVHPDGDDHRAHWLRRELGAPVHGQPGTDRLDGCRRSS